MLQGLKQLAQEIHNSDDCRPMQNLEVGISYQYFTAEEDLFSRNFIFSVVSDERDHYIIDIEKQYQTPMYKNFELLEAFHAGKIIRLGKIEKKA